MPLDKGLNLFYLLGQACAATAGAVVEFGCYRGFSALILAMSCDRTLHIYDSFEGLPDQSDEDRVPYGAEMRSCDRLDNARIGKGWFATSRSEVESRFLDASLPLPHIHEGWFEKLTSEDVPQQIAFAHIDGDFYTSTLAALEAIYPRMPAGGIILLDDYCDPQQHGRQSQLPGVKRACDFFFADKREKAELLATAPDSYQAYVRKA